MKPSFWGPLLASSVVFAPALASAEALSADAAVSRAAQNNPSLRAALLDAAAAGQALSAEEGARDPLLFATVQGEHSETISRARGSAVAPELEGAAIRTGIDTLTGNAAVRYTTDVGTELELGTRVGATDSRTSWSGTTPIAANLGAGPTYNASGYLSARQPLLRGAGRDAQLAPIDRARAGHTAARHRADAAASQTALDVLGAYWELWYAERAVQVTEQALEVAKRLVHDAKVRADTLGTGARVDTLSFQTSAASIADSLSQARAARTARAIELGRILGLEPLEARALEAQGEPPELGGLLDMESLVQAARDVSPQAAALRADMERTSINVRAARDADQPRVDLFATASVGTLWDDDAGFSLTGGRPTYGILGGVELELPLGSGRFSADARRAQLELEAAEARYDAELDRIVAEVSSLGASLDAAREQVELAGEAAGAARELAEAERQRMLLGTTTAQNVVTAEQTLREAELRLLRARVSQVSTRFQIDHVTGALLPRFAGALTRKAS